MFNRIIITRDNHVLVNGHPIVVLEDGFQINDPAAKDEFMTATLTIPIESVHRF